MRTGRWWGRRLTRRPRAAIPRPQRAAGRCAPSGAALAAPSRKSTKRICASTTGSAIFDLPKESESARSTACGSRWRRRTRARSRAEILHGKRIGKRAAYAIGGRPGQAALVLQTGLSDCFGATRAVRAGEGNRSGPASAMPMARRPTPVYALCRRKIRCAKRRVAQAAVRGMAS